MKLSDKKVILSGILNSVADYGCNIIAINQEMPVNETAFVTLTIDIIELEISMDKFLEAIKNLNGLKTIELIAME